MMYAKVCGHKLWVPDNVAEWDAVAEDSPWEKERMDSILDEMGRDDVLYDIGAEHGWMSAIFAHETGCRMVLVEPTVDFWPNIRGCWEYNALQLPVATTVAFCADGVRAGEHGPNVIMNGWPREANGSECAARDYYHLQHPQFFQPPTVTIDALRTWTGASPTGITIDVEGAELLVLRGAAKTLLEARPLVWVSIHPDLMARDYGHTPDRIVDFMRTAGYEGTLLRVDHEEHHLFRPLP